MLLNAYWEALGFELPELPEGQRWACLVDAGRPSPEDFVDPPELLSEGALTYVTQPRSAAVLVERNVSPKEDGA